MVCTLSLSHTMWPDSQAQCVDTCSSDESDINSSDADSNDDDFIASESSEDDEGSDTEESASKDGPDSGDNDTGEDEACDAKVIKAPLKRQCNRRVLLSDSDDDNVEVPTVMFTVGAIDIPDIQEGDGDGDVRKSSASDGERESGGSGFECNADDDVYIGEDESDEGLGESKKLMEAADSLTLRKKRKRPRTGRSTA
jgi:hypothetical protein